MKSRLQNKVAGSAWTLPVCAVAAAGMWWLPEREPTAEQGLGLAVCLLTAYVLMETNAREHIIRIRTRLMSAVWLILAASLPFMHPLREPIAVAALLAVSYALLFRCYQKHRPQKYVFHAFLMLGLGSFLAPAMLPMAVLYLFYLAVFLRSLTAKAFWAAIIGVVVPYWCYAIWCFVMGDVQSLLDLWTRMTQFEMPSAEAVMAMPLANQVATGVVVLTSIVSIIHYLSTNYDDKIRVRMYLYIYVAQTVLLTALLFAQPAWFETTMAMLLCSSCPLIAHYFALSRSWLTTAFFLLTIVLTAGMAVIHLWPASLTLLGYFTN